MARKCHTAVFEMVELGGDGGSMGQRIKITKREWWIKHPDPNLTAGGRNGPSGGD